ncbi:bifunctional diaminohydroxyphosphoribosylaminopyrimidine deaminase/5-amino-6-(5-phosphoribosylamino)uracil reductase RibD [Paenibacillus yanchengensis]|uniref:Riboflavin biosynthesis protein RibD n=1 Tax=Paenibacillus yanchengensis TaxID=2035833 RepID=A0ABW4YKC3_9BACL
MVVKMNEAFYMQTALQLAATALGQTGINPVVGCVIVNSGVVVGLGAHLMRGEAHAEVNALRMAEGKTNGATAYVTLEPCSHYGSTPPCCDALIQAGVKKVVIATLDPNPLVAGQGVAKLEAHGIEVSVGVLELEARSLNEKFNYFITSRLPFVTLKTASTLDGKIATATGDSRWITSSKAREEVHAMRHQHSAIMVGVNTIITDDPSLTTRLDVPALHPIRIIADSTLQLPLDAKLLHDKLAPVIILTTTQANADKRQQLELLGVEVIDCGDGLQVDLSLAMRLLGEHNISSILLEGGGTLNGAMLKAKIVNKIILYVGAKIVGDPNAPSNFNFTGVNLMADAVSLEQVHAEMVGEDIKISGYPIYKEEGG